jgi:O-antigen/teichoic acid export membrane protein
MSVQRIETLTWVLIYGGLIAICLGWFLTPTHGPWGELLMTGGVIGAAVGIVLIIVRSRMKQP